MTEETIIEREYSPEEIVPDNSSDGEDPGLPIKVEVIPIPEQVIPPPHLITVIYWKGRDLEVPRLLSDLLAEEEAEAAALVEVEEAAAQAESSSPEDPDKAEVARLAWIDAQREAAEEEFRRVIALEERAAAGERIEGEDLDPDQALREANRQEWIAQLRRDAEAEEARIAVLMARRESGESGEGEEVDPETREREAARQEWIARQRRDAEEAEEWARRIGTLFETVSGDQLREEEAPGAESGDNSLNPEEVLREHERQEWIARQRRDAEEEELRVRALALEYPASESGSLHASQAGERELGSTEEESHGSI